jgi:MGT family glycosyltransferase
VTVTLARRAAAALVTLPREFDDWPQPPAGVAHVGWIADDAPDSRWRSPWAPDDRRPLVVVTLGTTYMQQEEVIARVVQGLSRQEARVLVLTGPELDPTEVEAPEGVVVERYVPHAAVLPEAALVVAHGGTGTLLAALSAGVPVLSLPLGRDQPENARRLEELGLGRALAREASPTEIADAAAGMLGSRELSARVRTFAAVIRSYDSRARAAAALEDLCAAELQGA